MRTVTIKELSNMVGLSESTLIVHLVHFDKYRIISRYPLRYKYNENFLQDLRQYYEKKAQTPRYEVAKHYRGVLKNVNCLIKDYNKKAS